MKAKELGIWIGVIVALIGGLWFLISAVNNSPSPSAPTEIKIPEVSAQDFIRGTESASNSARLPAPERSDGGQAKVTLVEYADFQCPACASVYPIIKKLETDFSQDLRVVYRFFPLTNVHKNALVSAQAAYVAGKQNKFWEMHDMIYENQESWSGNVKAKDTFIGYAKDLKLDLEKFKNDMNANSTREFINKSANDAIALGINSTPTFFVNGKHIQNPGGLEEFKKIIQDEINKK